MDVSIVIPFYNSEKILDRCIDSCINQSRHPKKVICVNDGSKDNTLIKLNNYKDKYREISVIDKKNGGICSARNAGLEYVETEYVAFLDHDDVMHRDKLNHQLDILDKAGDSFGFVASSYIDIYAYNGGLEKKLRSVYRNDEWVALIHARLGRTSSNLWKTDTVREMGAWDTRDGLSLDTGLMFRLMKHGFHPLIDDVVHTTRYVTATSASHKNRVGQWSTFFDMRVSILRYLTKAGLLTTEREEALCIDLISALHGLFAESPEMAVSQYQRLPVDRSVVSQYSIGPGRLYRYLYKYFGFARAERIYTLWLAARRVSS